MSFLWQKGPLSPLLFILYLELLTQSITVNSAIRRYVKLWNCINVYLFHRLRFSTGNRTRNSKLSSPTRYQTSFRVLSFLSGFLFFNLGVEGFGVQSCTDALRQRERGEHWKHQTKRYLHGAHWKRATKIVRGAGFEHVFLGIEIRHSSSCKTLWKKCFFLPVAFVRVTERNTILVAVLLFVFHVPHGTRGRIAKVALHRLFGVPHAYGSE